MIESSFYLRRRHEVGVYVEFFLLSVVNEDVTEVHSHLSLAVLGQTEVNCSKIVVTLASCEQMERFHALSVDKLMSGIQVSNEDYILLSS